MFHAKFDQTVYQLRLAPRFLRNLQTAQGVQLNVEIAHFARALAKSFQYFQEFLLLAIALRKQFLEQRLQPEGRCAKAVDALGVLPRGEFRQSPLRVVERQLALLGCDRHKNEYWMR